MVSFASWQIHSDFYIKELKVTLTAFKASRVIDATLAFDTGGFEA